MPSLPYRQDALSPYMSAETLSYHVGKHLQTYIDNVNRLKKDSPFAESSLRDMVKHACGNLYNNAAQAYNHLLFFHNLCPLPDPPSPWLVQALQVDFKSLDGFKNAFSEAALALFGSGWIWLAADTTNKLHIIPMENAGNPYTKGLTPLLTLDVWEHAYYIDYRNRRADYVNNFWKIVNWEYVERRLKQGENLIYY